MSENTPPRERPSSSLPEDPAFKAPEALIWGAFLDAAGIALAGVVLSGADIWTLDYWGSDDRSAVLRNLGLLVIAVPALYLAWKRTTTATRQAHTANENKEISNRQQRVAERGLNIDRYQKGAQMLESKELSVRIAGIFGLRDLAMSDPEESYILVQSLLFAFIREKSKERKLITHVDNEELARPTYEDLGPDVYEALSATTALRSAVPTAKDLEEKAAWRPDLRQSNFRMAKLSFADLCDADLYDANLSGAILKSARLIDADLQEANLTNARLLGARLIDADFQEAILAGAQFIEADLTRADLAGSDLSKAVFFGTNLSDSDFDDVLVDNKTSFNGIWAWADRRPLNMPPEIEAVIELRDPAGREEGD